MGYSIKHNDEAKTSGMSANKKACQFHKKLAGFYIKVGLHHA